MFVSFRLDENILMECVGKMKSQKIKKWLALILSSVAMVAATTASTMCIFFLFDEPKMPKSLYKVG